MTNTMHQVDHEILKLRLKRRLLIYHRAYETILRNAVIKGGKFTESDCARAVGELIAEGFCERKGALLCIKEQAA